MLPLKNVSQGWLCTIGFGGFGHDWKCSGTVHAGIQAGSSSIGPGRSGDLFGGQDLGDIGSDAAQLGKGGSGGAIARDRGQDGQC